MTRGGDHKAARARLAKAGVVGMPCARCGRPIQAGQEWDADHVDRLWAEGGGGRLLPSHRYCNRAHGARVGNQRRGQQRKGQGMGLLRPFAGGITVWPSVGVEVSADRHRTYVVRAAFRDDGRVQVDNMTPVEGVPDRAVPVIVGWLAEWQAQMLTLDAVGQAAGLAAPLKARAPAQLNLAGAHELAVAHGKLQDLIFGRRTKLSGDRSLHEAARQAGERRVGGAMALVRHQGDHAAALIAAELAVGALDEGLLGPLIHT